MKVEEWLAALEADPSAAGVLCDLAEEAGLRVGTLRLTTDAFLACGREVVRRMPNVTVRLTDRCVVWANHYRWFGPGVLPDDECDNVPSELFDRLVELWESRTAVGGRDWTGIRSNRVW